MGSGFFETGVEEVNKSSGDTSENFNFLLDSSCQLEIKVALKERPVQKEKNK